MQPALKHQLIAQMHLESTLAMRNFRRKAETLPAATCFVPDRHLAGKHRQYQELLCIVTGNPYHNIFPFMVGMISSAILRGDIRKDRAIRPVSHTSN